MTLASYQVASKRNSFCNKQLGYEASVKPLYKHTVSTYITIFKGRHAATVVIILNNYPYHYLHHLLFLKFSVNNCS